MHPNYQQQLKSGSNVAKKTPVDMGQKIGLTGNFNYISIFNHLKDIDGYP